MNKSSKPISKRGELIAETRKLLLFAEMWIKECESQIHYRPNYINKQTGMFEYSKRYPRNTSADRHKNQVMFKRQREDADNAKVEIEYYQLAKVKLRLVLDDLINGTNNTQNLELNKFNTNRLLTNLTHIRLHLDKVADYINFRFPNKANIDAS